MLDSLWLSFQPLFFLFCYYRTEDRMFYWVFILVSIIRILTRIHTFKNRRKFTVSLLLRGISKTNTLTLLIQYAVSLQIIAGAVILELWPLLIAAIISVEIVRQTNLTINKLRGEAQ